MLPVTWCCYTLFPLFPTKRHRCALQVCAPPTPAVDLLVNCFGQCYQSMRPTKGLLDSQGLHGTIPLRQSVDDPLTVRKPSKLRVARARLGIVLAAFRTALSDSLRRFVGVGQTPLPPLGAQANWLVGCHGTLLLLRFRIYLLRGVLNFWRRNRPARDLQDQPDLAFRIRVRSLLEEHDSRPRLSLNGVYWLL